MNANGLRPAPGVRVIYTPDGEFVGGQAGSRAFQHRFKPTLTSGGVRFTRGIVMATIAHEPTIGGIPISGNSNNAAPILPLDPGVAKKGESWACVELTPNKDGSTDAQTKVEVVHRSEPFILTDDKTGRHPLCMILWNGDKPALAFPIAMFNLRYFRTTPGPGKGKMRHYFL